MPYCCVSYCYNKTANGSRLFPLPQGKKNETRRKEWLQNINRYDLPLNSFICEDHFTEDQFHDEGDDGIRPLKHDAVPTIFSKESKMVVKPVNKKEISLESIKQECNKQVMCRTCFSYRSKQSSFLITKLINGETVKDLMLRLVPQMSHTITDESYICNRCMTSLCGSIEFIDTCLEIETKIKNGQLIYDASEVLQTDDKESSSDIKEKIIPSVVKPQMRHTSNAVSSTLVNPHRLVRIIPLVDQTYAKKRGRKPRKDSSEKVLKTFPVTQKNADQNSSISQKDSEICTEESADSETGKINSPKLETIVVKGDISNDADEGEVSEKISKIQGLRSSTRIRTRRKLKDCAEEKEIDEFLKKNEEDETYDDQEVETPKRRKRRETDDSVEDKDYEEEQLIASPKKRRKRKDVEDSVEESDDAYWIRMEKKKTVKRDTSPVLRVIHNPMRGTIRTYERKKKSVSTENIPIKTENSLVTTENISVTTENILITTENSLATTEKSLAMTENSLATTENSLVSKDPDSSPAVDSQRSTDELDVSPIVHGILRVDYSKESINTDALDIDVSQIHVEKPNPIINNETPEKLIEVFTQDGHRDMENLESDESQMDTRQRKKTLEDEEICIDIPEESRVDRMNVRSLPKPIWKEDKIREIKSIVGHHIEKLGRDKLNQPLSDRNIGPREVSSFTNKYAQYIENLRRDTEKAETNKVVKPLLKEDKIREVKSYILAYHNEKFGTVSDESQIQMENQKPTLEDGEKRVEKSNQTNHRIDQHTENLEENSPEMKVPELTLEDKTKNDGTEEIPIKAPTDISKHAQLIEHRGEVQSFGSLKTYGRKRKTFGSENLDVPSKKHDISGTEKLRRENASLITVGDDEEIRSFLSESSFSTIEMLVREYTEVITLGSDEENLDVSSESVPSMIETPCDETIGSEDNEKNLNFSSESRSSMTRENTEMTRLRDDEESLHVSYESSLSLFENTELIPVLSDESCQIQEESLDCEEKSLNIGIEPQNKNFNV